MADKKTYYRFCDLCGLDFKAHSPFAKMCPECKKVRFKKPEPIVIDPKRLKIPVGARA